MQAIQPNSFIPAMRLGTIDFYHFIPLSLTLTFLDRSLPALAVTGFLRTPEAILKILRVYVT